MLKTHWSGPDQSPDQCDQIFTGGDTILVHVAQEQEMVAVSVRDFGIGIAKEYQQHIFDRFYRVDDPEERTYPGLGSGLHIADELLTLVAKYLYSLSVCQTLTSCQSFAMISIRPDLRSWPLF